MTKLKYLLSFILFSTVVLNSFAQNGFIVEYYNGTDFNRKVATKYCPDINFYWDFNTDIDDLYAEKFSAKFYGKIIAPETGKYKIGFVVDDGVRLWINDKLIIDAWALNNKVFYSKNYVMEEGETYDFRIEYFNGMLEGKLELRWQLPNTKTFDIINSEYLEDISTNKRTVLKPIVDTTVKIIPQKPIQIQPKPKPITEKPIQDTIKNYIPKNILFKQSTSIMIGKSEEELALLASFLKRFPALKVSIEGHTDIMGNVVLNQKLSEQRAQAVLKHLCSLGIDSNRLIAVGYGGTKPIYNTNGENRRVEFIIN